MKKTLAIDMTRKTNLSRYRLGLHIFAKNGTVSSKTCFEY